eukprot:scaffold1023_cov313-Pinguiococcus_pyrenoidosus.AAC.21
MLEKGPLRVIQFRLRRQIDIVELSTVLRQLGETVSSETLQKHISDVDLDGSQTIDFAEFVTMMAKIRGGNEEAAANVVRASTEPRLLPACPSRQLERLGCAGADGCTRLVCRWRERRPGSLRSMARAVLSTRSPRRRRWRSPST